MVYRDTVITCLCSSNPGKVFQLSSLTCILVHGWQRLQLWCSAVHAMCVLCMAMCTPSQISDQMAFMRCRPIAKIYATQMSYPSGVPTTTASTSTFLIAISEPVPSLNTTDFTVTGPVGATARLMQYPGSSSIYRLAVDVPPTYCGQVSLSLTGAVTNVQGQALCPAQACSSITWTKSCGSCAPAPVAGIEVVKPLRDGGSVCI